MFDYKMEHLYSYTATLQAPVEAIGPVPEGIRVNFYITGGMIRGERLNGRVRPVGADCFLVRRDGIGDLGEDGYDKFLRGELPKTLPLRTGPTMRTAHPAYQWLQRLHCVAVGEVDLERFEVSYDVYAVR